MNKYKFLYLFWLIPAYLLFLSIHQGAVYFSITDTYENGSSYTANVMDFEFKQIAAQTNGYIVLQFETDEGERIERKLSFAVEMAGALTDLKAVPIRYKSDAFQSIVMTPTYGVQKQLTLTNLAMAFLGFLITAAIGRAVHRFVQKKIQHGDQQLVIERIDNDE